MTRREHQAREQHEQEQHEQEQPEEQLLRTGGQILVDQLAAHGVGTVFGVPGESYLEVLDALHDSSVRMVVCRQEGGAAYMAEATGKLTGRPGVCFTTRGPGAANALVALHTADQDATPLVLFVGLVPRGHTGRAGFQEFDLRGTFGAHAKLVETADEAARLPEITARAFAVAAGGRPGPVVVGLPEDMLTDTAHAADAQPLPVPEGAVSPDQLGSLEALLAQAVRPLVVLGGSRWTEDARRDVRAWAEAWSLPVAVDFRCQDLIPGDSDIFAGNLGYGRPTALAERLGSADLLICVGAAPGDVTTDGYTRLDRPEEPEAGLPRRIVHVLPDWPPPGAWHRCDLPVLASPAAFGRAVAGLRPAGPVAWAETTRADRAAHLEFRRTLHDPEPLDLGAVFATLDARLDADAVVTFGAGNYALWAQRFLTYRDGMRQLAPRNGSMGYGLPAGVAAAVTMPGRQVVTFAGDGCFLMNGQELSTGLAEGAAPLVLVVDNGTYGTIRKHQELAHPGRVSGTDLVNPDFAAYARAFGAHGETVCATGEFAPALERALVNCRAGRAALIALRPSEGRLAPGMTVASLREAAAREAGGPR
ncbi:thiamine pyrophosphate-binding protein [Streptomyces sp. WMMB 322]|uniref:thiamine pyrophosphate-binding protein n=1 Tax=Streptomyces sp. WMMB 322 TaxID=1286821 RepID=UPI000823DAC2|nr:thiamine pyrophosphate-binding protein [Streptomyces sp. WMMB 322]SCK31352.1 acetolactate synthase-1/2/3 large subunit [Streptomyces sp. WMMB 322]